MAAIGYTACRYRRITEHRVATLRAVACSDVALSTGGVAVSSGGTDVNAGEVPTCRGKNLA